MHFVPMVVAALLGVVFWRQVASAMAAGAIVLLVVGLALVGRALVSGSGVPAVLS